MQTRSNQIGGSRIYHDSYAAQLESISEKLDSLLSLKNDIAAIKEAWLARTAQLTKESDDDLQSPLADVIQDITSTQMELMDPSSETNLEQQEDLNVKMVGAEEIDKIDDTRIEEWGVVKNDVQVLEHRVILPIKSESSIACHNHIHDEDRNDTKLGGGSLKGDEMIKDSCNREGTVERKRTVAECVTLNSYARRGLHWKLVMQSGKGIANEIKELIVCELTSCQTNNEIKELIVCELRSCQTNYRIVEYGISLVKQIVGGQSGAVKISRDADEDTKGVSFKDLEQQGVHDCTMVLYISRDLHITTSITFSESRVVSKLFKQVRRSASVMARLTSFIYAFARRDWRPPWYFAKTTLNASNQTKCGPLWVLESGQPILERLLSWLDIPLKEAIRKNDDLLAVQCPFRLEDKSILWAGSIDTNPVMGQPQWEQTQVITTKNSA